MFPSPKETIKHRMPTWIVSANDLVAKCKRAVYERTNVSVDIEDEICQEAIDYAISVIEDSYWKANCVLNFGNKQLEIHPARPCYECSETGLSSNRRSLCTSCKGTKTR